MHNSSYSLESLIKNNDVYVFNKTNFPITIKYVECTYDYMTGIPKEYCSDKEITKQITGNNALNIGKDVFPIPYKVNGKFFALTYLSNNVTSKRYTNNLETNSEIRCLSQFKTKRILIIDDYNTVDKIFCYASDYSGVQK